MVRTWALYQTQLLPIAQRTLFPNLLAALRRTAPATAALFIGASAGPSGSGTSGGASAGTSASGAADGKMDVEAHAQVFVEGVAACVGMLEAHVAEKSATTAQKSAAEKSSAEKSATEKSATTPTLTAPVTTALDRYVQALGRRHARHGVTRAHARAFAHAFLAAVAQTVGVAYGARWTRQSGACGTCGWVSNG